MADNMAQQGQHAKKTGKKPSNAKKIVIIAIIAVAVIAAVAAGIGMSVANAMEQENRENVEYYAGHFFDNEKIGGVDVSRMDASEAAEAVNAAVGGAAATVADGNEAETFTAADAKVEEVPEKFFEDLIANQDPESWRDGCAKAGEHELPELSYDRDALLQKMANMDCVSGSDRADAVDAKLLLEDGKFSVEPGRDGNRADVEMLADAVMESITGGAYDATYAAKARDDRYQVLKDDIADAKAAYKELRSSFVDSDKDGWDDEKDVVIADALAAEQAKVDSAEAALEAEKQARLARQMGTNAEEAASGIGVVELSGVTVGGEARRVDAAEYYAHPTWTGEEEQFQAAQDKAEKWLGAKIDYTVDMLPHAIVVDKDVIEDFIVVNQEDIDVELDEDAMKAWLHEQCKPFDTVGSTRSYTTPAGTNIELSGGHYGWMTDENAELPKLVASIESGEIVSRDMSYESEAAGPKGEFEWGNTYVDVNRSEQLVRYIVNGEVVFTADTVTGSSDAAHETQTGFYSVIYKDSPHVMVGDIVPSTGKPEYETPCTYFTLFNYNGSAFHDADHIRSNWSKTAWTWGGGSHGCCNMHYSDAAYIYNNVAYGTPVIVHD